MNKKLKLLWPLTAVLLLGSVLAPAQIYEDYLGMGHDRGVRVSSSGDMAGTASATMARNGIDSAYMKVQASRFLAQASLGANRYEIERVAEMGIEEWIDEQLNIPPGSLLALSESRTAFRFELCEQYSDEPDECEIYAEGGAEAFQEVWWHYLMTEDDHLRQKVAFALSELLVVSGEGLEEGYGPPMADYYDILLRNAFGNYKDLLLEVTLHPLMGQYLTHMNNPKTDPVLNIRPDENYAREIMQLFSIGLEELNMDGTPITDASGIPIPTYNNQDIKQFAKVFTGLGNGSPDGEFGEEFDPFLIDYTRPMRMYEAQHEPGEKYLLNGFVIPAGQSGMKDINDAVQHLVDHANTAPFISYRLIQRLVSSNPSPDYVRRIAEVFADNGNGVRGDLGAVVKAILLDVEARECRNIDHKENGKLREPLLRAIHLIKAMNAYNEVNEYYNIPENIYEDTRQITLFAPSVFNFFQPTYQPNGPIAEARLRGPEFQIHNTSTSIGYINLINEMTFYESTFILDNLFEEFGLPFNEDDYEVFYDTSPYLDLLQPGVLLDELNLLLCHDQLSARTKEIILRALEQMDDEYERLLTALYLIMISPDYNILK